MSVNYTNHLFEVSDPDSMFAGCTVADWRSMPDLVARLKHRETQWSIDDVMTACVIVSMADEEFQERFAEVFFTSKINHLERLVPTPKIMTTEVIVVQLRGPQYIVTAVEIDEDMIIYDGYARANTTELEVIELHGPTAYAIARDLDWREGLTSYAVEPYMLQDLDNDTDSGPISVIAFYHLCTERHLFGQQHYKAPFGNQLRQQLVDLCLAKVGQLIGDGTLVPASQHRANAVTPATGLASAQPTGQQVVHSSAICFPDRLTQPKELVHQLPAVAHLVFATFHLHSLEVACH